MQFDVLNKDNATKARAGIIHTEHGEIPTPIFIPVGSGGTVKGILQRDLEEEVKASIILGNTYHLYLRPGIEIIKRAGGLHKFINWSKPVITDSGGYQIFSLAENRKITNEGVVFKSHIDGSRHFFSPEKVVDIQRLIGADIIMALDECTPYPCDYKYARKSMQLTHAWLERGKQQYESTESKYNYYQSFVPIVQGSIFKDLRIESAEKIASMNCKANAIGGLSVGEPESDMYEIIGVVNKILPEDKPRYLMGIGTPANILELIAMGIDMFDCVLPTRNGRNGMLFTRNGIINIRNQHWKDDFSRLDPDGSSSVSKQYSKAYLRHLIISKELLGAQIASIHNLSFYLWLVSEARQKIITGEFLNWKNDFVNKLSSRL
jgi:queuine tRNA-ribosyltransferase